MRKSRRNPSVELDAVEAKNLKLKTVNGADLNIQGKTSINIQVTNDCIVKLDLEVTNESPFDIILGYNFLEKFEYLQTNYKSHQVVVNTYDGKVPCRLSSRTCTRTSYPQKSDYKRPLEF